MFITVNNLKQHPSHQHHHYHQQQGHHRHQQQQQQNSDNNSNLCFNMVKQNRNKIMFKNPY